MLQKCPLCGAENERAGQCRERFEACLALEFENPAYGAVHHLTVPSYMLQHNEYSRQAWIETWKLLDRFVNQGMTPAAMRQMMAAKFEGKPRKWRFSRGEKLAEFNTIVWSRTIADVRLDDPAVYCADVQRWAASIVADARDLMQML
jgi:hypothetical protein